jgi:hypothetical protein
MKTYARIISTALLLLVLQSRGQVAFVYDQQSADESFIAGSSVGIQAYSPMGQSFTPRFSSVGFARIYMSDGNFGNSLGATLYLNLRANSITGPILGTTDPVSMRDSFSGPVNFFFATPVPVVPGITYFLQPAVQTGDAWNALIYNTYNYPGGTAFELGVNQGVNDLWFREGIVAPEPSAALLLLLGGGGALVRLGRRSGSRVS